MVKSLFVGQRVRINYPPSSVHGEETVITALDCEGYDAGKTYLGAEVDLFNKELWDGRLVFEYHEIEPILPEGAQPSEFSFTELMDNVGVVVA